MENIEIKQRAVSDDQKQIRRQAILDTAWELFRQTSFQAITMAQVAERTGLAKGTVYLYFKTKEELFLSVQEQQFDSWFADINRLLAGATVGDVPEVTRRLCRSLEKRDYLIRLLSILHTILEQNIDYDVARHFKTSLLKHLQETGTVLEKVLPFLTAGQGGQVLLRIYALIIGLENMANPSQVVRQVLTDHPELQALQIDFKREFSCSVEDLLYGVAARAKEVKK